VNFMTSTKKRTRKELKLSFVSFEKDDMISNCVQYVTETRHDWSLLPAEMMKNSRTVQHGQGDLV
jgi:hypothetical protein